MVPCVVPDISRRSLLTGLFLAPVVAPAAAMGMVEDEPWSGVGDVFSGCTANVDDFEWTPIANRPEGWTPMPEFHISRPPAEGETCRIMSWTAGQDWFTEERQVFTSGQWLKVEDTTPHGPEDSRLSGTSPTLVVLDEIGLPEPDVLDRPRLVPTRG